MKFLLVVIALSLFLLASNSFAEEYEISGNFGGFLFTSTDPDFTDPWATAGYLMGGQFSIWINPKSAMCFDIENVRASKESRVDGTWTETDNNVLFFILLFKRRWLANSPISPYISGGFGFSSMTGGITADELYFEVSRTDFAIKTCIGLEMGKIISLEFGYLSGRRNGNTGIALSIRIGGYISK